MLNKLSDKMITGLVATLTTAASQTPDVVLDSATRIPLSTIAPVVVFGGSCVWWLSSRLQRGEDAIKQLREALSKIETHQQWQLNNHAILSENQKKLEQQFQSLPCEKLDCIDPVKLIGHPTEL